MGDLSEDAIGRARHKVDFVYCQPWEYRYAFDLLSGGEWHYVRDLDERDLDRVFDALKELRYLGMVDLVLHERGREKLGWRARWSVRSLLEVRRGVDPFAWLEKEF